MTSPVSQKLSDLLGPSALQLPDTLEDYAIDGVIPEAAVQPPDRKAVSEILSWASKERVPVFPRGGGTQLVLGNVPDRVGLVLDLSRQDRLLDYQPADMTATVEAGMPLSRLQQQLAADNQFLRLEAPLATRATIGGILAANTTGPSQFSYGQPRDWLIGIGVIQAGGQETKAGGKVVKNVTGYDLNKLYTGSLGTLGVIVEATFKLSPLPMDRGILVSGFSTLAEGISAGAGLLKQVYAPEGLQVIDGQVARQLDIVPAAMSPEGLEPEGSLALTFFSGRTQTVKRRIADSAVALRESGALHVDALDEVESSPLLQRLTDLGWDTDSRPYLGIKAIVPPVAVARVVESCRKGVPLGFPPGVVADPGFGMIRFFWWTESASDGIDDSLVLQTILRTRELAREACGFALVEHCPLAIKKEIDVWGEHPQGMEIMRRIKQQFDPMGILSPGRFLGRI